MPIAAPLRILLAVLVAAVAAAAEPASPAVPAGASVAWVQPGFTISAGKAWLHPTRFGHDACHLDGGSTVALDLAGLRTAPGWYRIGLLARTGTRMDAPTDHLAGYRLALAGGAGGQDLGMPLRLPGEAYQPVLEAGEPDAWGDWYAALQCPTPVHLAGGERLVVANGAGHGGVLALWALPVAGPDAAALAITTAAPENAFAAGQAPQVTVRITLPAELPAADGFLRLVRRDLLTDADDVVVLPVHLEPGRSQPIIHAYPALSGVFRVDASLVARADDSSERPVGTVRQLYACAPARLARDLPDDWPLGTHVEGGLAPLPGFRWYRYFPGWHRVEPARGVYDWAEFDRVVAAVRAVGGRLLIAGDGTPTWASSRGKAGMPWAATATAWPPDDWDDLATYLRAMLARYEDAAGTIGALELCNEANTRERWLGTPAELVAMARTFRAAVATARHPVAVVGLAVSAGDQRDYVQAAVDAGLLPTVDALSGHWYEELMSLERATPINSLPRHVDLIAEPMRRAGASLPIINSECGIAFVPRRDDRLVTQAELNRVAEADPAFDRQHPWIQHGLWRPVSERRAAATYVAGTVMLLAMGVERSFSFSLLGFLTDGAPSLPWVALGELGRHLDGVDWRTVQALDAHVVGSDGADGSPLALAYRLGRPGGRQVVVAWAFLSDTTVGRSKHWQRWLDPLPVDIRCDLPGVVRHDLYGRGAEPVTATDGVLRVACGEEPVFLEPSPAR